jgi:predicted nucleic acid-binding protein
VIFVDTNVWMYAVGRRHPRRDEARAFFREATAGPLELVTSAEVLQELLHAYLPVDRVATLDAALRLVEGSVIETWPVEASDVVHARKLVSEYPHLGARDLLHLACCRRRGVSEVRTFDRALAAAFQ